MQVVNEVLVEFVRQSMLLDEAVHKLEWFGGRPVSRTARLDRVASLQLQRPVISKENRQRSSLATGSG